MPDSGILPIKVNIDHKKEISEIIPEDVTRAKSSAWLDVISPITEWAGLKGDALKHKRQLMRLEREAALSELAEKLRTKLDGETITPIRPKILIPSLEKASLEAAESPFIERWANLLASEARSPGDDTATCASILGDLGKHEAELLDAMQKKLLDSDLWSQNAIINRFSVEKDFFEDIRSQAKSVLRELAHNKKTLQEANEELSGLISPSPNLVHSFRYSEHKEPETYMALEFTEEQTVAVDILKYRNLATLETYERLELGDPGHLAIRFFRLTNLGIRFLQRVSGEASW